MLFVEWGWIIRLSQFQLQRCTCKQFTVHLLTVGTYRVARVCSQPTSRDMTFSGLQKEEKTNHSASSPPSWGLSWSAFRDLNTIVEVPWRVNNESTSGGYYLIFLWLSSSPRFFFMCMDHKYMEYIYNLYYRRMLKSTLLKHLHFGA